MTHSQRGNGLLLVIMAFAVLFAVVGMSLDYNSKLVTTMYTHHLETAAMNLAEAGLAYAYDKLHTSDTFYGEENLQLDPRSTCTVSITQLTPSNKIEILTSGRVASQGARAADTVRTLRVVLQRNDEDDEQPFVQLSREVVL